MPDLPNSQNSAALCDFLDLFLEDRAAGRKRSLGEYLRRFPGHEEDVAREFLALLLPGADGATPDPASEGGGDRLGHYRLLEKLGHGGQGSVWLAEDVRLHRHVALKILDGGLGGLPATRVARLKLEAEALSRLDHPRLCAVYDIDLSGARPWFAMRYVAGETLAQRINRGQSHPGAGDSGRVLARTPATPREVDAAVRFVELAARAVHVAHEAGIIHRDLKPGNIMIDRDDEPVVLDFGLARDLGDDGAITVTGDAFGTLSYMSPEQLSGDRALDRRTDVYSLGVTLFECLTGRRPIEAATRESLLRGVLEGERQDPVVLNRAVPRDLAVVLACALDIERSRRYATALGFAEDLRRVRERQPILAKPAGWWTLTRRWAQRHPAAFAGGIATFTLLVAGLVVTSLLLARVTREQTQTRLEQSKLTALRQAYLAQVVGNEKPAVALRLAIEAARRERHPEINNILYDLVDRCYEKKTYAIGAKPYWVNLGYEPIVDGAGRLFVGYAGGIASMDLQTGTRSDLVSGRSQENGLLGPHLALARDRVTLASAHEDGTLHFWDLGTSSSREVRTTGQEAPTWIEFSPDSSLLATGASDGSVQIHRTETGAAPVRVELPGRTITTARFDPSGTRLVATGLVRAGVAPTNPAVVWDVKTGNVLAALGPTAAAGVFSAWSPDGARLAVACDSSVKVFRASDWSEERALPHGDLVYWLAFQPDQNRLVTGSLDGVTVWDLSSGARVATVGDFRERSVIRGAFSPDGSRLAVIAWDQTASIFSTDDWRETGKLRGMGRPRGVCWSADGSLIATTDEATTVHVWHAGDRPHLPILRGHGDRVVGVAFDAAGRRALTASQDGSARIFDAATGRVLLEMAHGRPLAAARLGPGGEVVTAGGGRVAVWDGETGTRLTEVLGPPPFPSARFARPGDPWPASAGTVEDAWPVADGKLFATYQDGTARLLEIRSGKVLRTFEGHHGPIVCAAFHEGRKLAATGGSDRSVRVVDLQTGDTVGAFSYPMVSTRGQPPATDLSRVFALAFDKPGDRVIAGCQDLRLRIWDIRSAKLVREEPAATAGMLELAPGGRWLMVGAKWMGRVSFLDLDDAGSPLRPAPFHDTHRNAAIRFSPGGELGLVASKDGTMRLWNMEAIRPQSVFDAKCGILLDAAFSPDGGRLIVGGSDRTARIWAVDPLGLAERCCPIDDEVWATLRPLLEQSLFTK